MKVSVKCVLRCLLKESAGVSRYLSEQEVKFVTAQATPPDVQGNSSHAPRRSPQLKSRLRTLTAFLLVQLNNLCYCYFLTFIYLFIYSLFYCRILCSQVILFNDLCSSVSFSEIFFCLSAHCQISDKRTRCLVQEIRLTADRRVTS